MQLLHKTPHNSAICEASCTESASSANLQFACIFVLRCNLHFSSRPGHCLGLVVPRGQRAGSRPHATSKWRKLLTDPSDWQPAFIIYLLFSKGHNHKFTATFKSLPARHGGAEATQLLRNIHRSVDFSSKNFALSSASSVVDNDPILGYLTAQIRRGRLHAIHFPNWTGEGNL